MDNLSGISELLGPSKEFFVVEAVMSPETRLNEDDGTIFVTTSSGSCKASWVERQAMMRLIQDKPVVVVETGQEFGFKWHMLLS
ncbi:hypothetical protein MGYG_00754 [Nannizzia gypsea CBS 118893]|uniref:Uncharacterized protein n=1 Tax=Arthroderma gypseum (strain ATCC MYA-4604 / CBS 118893) TaxID=535722 RepID=E5R1L6_ARTGP|nr:hypothetical protein MGYG_00754 [Nannizzia gypsea CBS 118893]EFQ97714.1 hypothetical protein MGYG_00754 [Nannizzia gypsea CBS 118893]